LTPAGLGMGDKSYAWQWVRMVVYPLLNNVAYRVLEPHLPPQYTIHCMSIYIYSQNDFYNV
jgi:hypothetical protein